MQQKGSAIVQERDYWTYGRFEAPLMMCASLHLRNDVHDLQKNGVENKSEEELSKCGDIACKQSTFVLWKPRTFDNAQTEHEQRDGWIVFHYTLVKFILPVWSRLRSMIKLNFHLMQGSTTLNRCCRKQNSTDNLKLEFGITDTRWSQLHVHNQLNYSNFSAYLTILCGMLFYNVKRKNGLKW